MSRGRTTQKERKTKMENNIDRLKQRTTFVSAGGVPIPAPRRRVRTVQGGAIGGGIGTLAGLAIPGLGLILGPALGAIIGAALGQEADRRRNGQREL
jgi:outer membrane lipoprotein SlyB